KLPVVFCAAYEQYEEIAKRLGGAPAPREAAGLYFSGANFSLFFDFAKSDSLKELSAKVAALQDQLRQSHDPKENRDKSQEVQFYKNRIDVTQNRANKSVVQHEVAHQLLYNFNLHSRKVRNPSWFVEGLATLFEPPPTEGAGAGFNIINQDRLGTLRD